MDILDPIKHCIGGSIRSSVYNENEPISEYKLRYLFTDKMVIKPIFPTFELIVNNEPITKPIAAKKSIFGRRG